MNKLTFVTDQGPNMTSTNGLGYYNTVLKHVFDSNFLDAEDEEHRKIMGPITKLMLNAENVVKYMKISGEVNKLSKGLKQEAETRWNTRLAMLLSIHEQWHEMLILYGEEFYRIKFIDIDLLKKITDFLIPFKDASDQY